jgi:putative endopeptidase
MSGRHTRKRNGNCPRADNFYGTLNDAWFRATAIPSTETRITQAYFIRERVNDELDKLIDDECRKGKDKGLIASFVSSWRAAEGHIIPDGTTALLQLMLSIDGPAAISSRIGWMNRHGLAAPIAVYVQGDPRNHTICRVFIEEGSPSIGIPEYWLWDEYTAHRKAYATYVRRLATTLGMPALLQGYGAEREFAHVYPSALERRAHIDTLTWSELQSTFRVIDWTGLLTAWGLDAATLPSLRYNVTSKAFLHHMQSRMTTWSVNRWRGWFALIVAQWVAGCSPHGPLRSAWFAFSRQFLQGMPSDDTPRELRHAAVRSMMPNTLGKLWVRHACDPTLRTRIRAMVERIRAAAAVALRSTTWMSPSTRKEAIRKLRAMEVQVCWPDLDDWPEPELGCDLSDTDLLMNMLRIAQSGTERNQALIKSGSCKNPLGKAWGRPVFEVNAFYYPDENRFLLPAAILRPPFYDTEKSAAWNYGAIGATIGHEFCHAFDSDGRLYDEHGNKRDWWTTRDDKAYRAKARRVTTLYESRPYRGLEVNGSLTLVENIADLGGLEFALAGLRSVLGRTLTKEELREFFTAYAISWRSKDRMKRAAELLATDPHSPPMLRVNHAVRQMDEWYEAFDVGPECAEYVAPKDRIRFFG